MKTIPISYIGIDEEIDSIRELKLEMIGKYMEKYESGTSKPILVERIKEGKFILIDGKHRLEACKKLKRNKIDIEEFDGEDIYSKAVECNQEHGIPLTKEEEEKVLIKFVEQGKTQEQIAKVFHVGQTAIAMRIKRNPLLAKSLSDKINISTINELLLEKKQSEVANIYGITQGRVSQIWGNFVNEMTELYNTGTPKEEIIQIKNEKNINLTQEKLNELIEEDYNKLITGDCLIEIPKLDNEIIDCLIIDPPYGIEYQSNRRKDKHSKIENDGSESFDLLNKSLNLIQPKLKKNCHIYIFTSWKVIDKVKPIIESKFHIKNCLVWNKMNHGSGDLEGNYSDQYELIIFAEQGKKKLCVDSRPINILNYLRTLNKEHPTEKPIELLKELIRNSTKEKDLVLDYFAGSGSTLNAAKDEKRRWLGIELK